jgi:hypothetical protein
MRRSIKKNVDAGAHGKTQNGRLPGMKTEFPHPVETLTDAFFQLQSVVGNQAVQRWCESDPHERFPGSIGKPIRFNWREVSKIPDANPVVQRTQVQRQPATAIDEQAQKQAAKKIRDAFTFPDGYVSPKFTPSNAKLVGKAKEMLAPGGGLAKEMAQGRDVTYERELETGGTQSFTEKKSVTVPGDVSKFPVLVTWELWSMLEALKTSAPDATLLALIGVLEEFWIDHTGNLGTTWVPDIVEINAVLPAKGFTKVTSVDLIPRSIVFVDQHALVEPGPYRDLSEGEKEKRTVDIVAAHELIHALGYVDAWIHPFLKQFGLSPKLERDAPGGEEEQEADRVAAAVMDPGNKENVVRPLAEGTVPETTETTRYPQKPFSAGSRHSRPGLIQRAPFPGETPELEQRRKDAIEAVQSAARKIERGLRSGYLWPFEQAQGTDIQFTSPTLTIPGQSPLETQKDRNARLLKLADDLWKLVIELQGGPIPQAWQAWKDSSDDVIFPGQGRYGSGFEIDMFYCHRMQEHGMGFAETMRNIHYIDDTPDPQRQIRIRLRDLPPESELQLGTWLVVKDPVNRPQEWKRLSGYEPIDGEIVQLSSDRRGYFYYWYGEKKYLPDYPD